MEAIVYINSHSVRIHPNYKLYLYQKCFQRTRSKQHKFLAKQRSKYRLSRSIVAFISNTCFCSYLRKKVEVLRFRLVLQSSTNTKQKTPPLIKWMRQLQNFPPANIAEGERRE